jgi:hypothetical protein
LGRCEPRSIQDTKHVHAEEMVEGALRSAESAVFTCRVSLEGLGFDVRWRRRRAGFLCLDDNWVHLLRTSFLCPGTSCRNAHQQVVSSTCMDGRETSCRNAPAVSCTCLGSMQVHAHHSFVIRVRVSTQGMYSNRAWTGSRSMYNGGAMKLAPPRCTLIGLFVCVRMHHGSQLAS